MAIASTRTRDDVIGHVVVNSGVFDSVKRPSGDEWSSRNNTGYG